MGNHTWGKKDIFKFIDHPKLIRPANYPEGVVGKGYSIYNCKNKKIAVINLIGRVGITVLSENPFLKVKEIINEIKNKADIIVIDFHAEATAEKTILPKGTAYITDIGMTGPKNSVIGMDIEASIKRFETTLPERYKIATGEAMLNAVVFDIDDANNKVKSIKRINS